jgi:hypothetical protein
MVRLVLLYSLTLNLIFFVGFALTFFWDFNSTLNILFFSLYFFELIHKLKKRNKRGTAHA